jgi:tetratricopeptide (TPR) repeat protein
MKKKSAALWGMLVLVLLTASGLAQKKMMTWSTKSEKAKEIALKGASHMKNIEFEQAYDDFKTALSLDPDFTVALVFMANLTSGETKKWYSEEAVKSAANKTEGEKLFASIVAAGHTPESNRATWAKLHDMFPDGSMIGAYYAITRATPDEQFTAAQDFIKKFPDDPCMYNMIAYYYMTNKKDTATAKIYFEKYIKLYPEGSNPYDSMGEFYFNTGDMTNAEKYYNMALEKYPFQSSSIDKLKEIKTIKEKNAAK